MATKNVIAVDLGAESGRVMQAAFDGERLRLEEVYRFPNIPVQAGGTLYWDVLRLWHEITTGIEMAQNPAAIGIDAWGVDFALLDRDGRLVANPAHYRDSRTEGMLEWAFERMPRREIFERTGIQFMAINGLYQIASLARNNSPQLEIAETFLTIADLFNYWLTGSKTCEFTHATTQQCYNPHIGDWDRELLAALEIPTHIFPEILRPGARIGAYHEIPVILPACHDTGSAVVAVPTTTENYAYLSSGTWSLLGLELNEPVINDASYEANLTNEGGAYGTFRLLKNIMGLWLAQQSRATWMKEGREYSYAQLAAMAEEAPSFTAFIEPDDPRFLYPGDMPSRVREYCEESGQAAPLEAGQVMRVIYESLALKYRLVLDQLIRVSGKEVDQLHIIGGGSQNTILCQMTANATGRVVIAGPAEATAMGNAIAQLISLGELQELSQMRELLSRAEDLRRYEPENTLIWEEQYQRYCDLIG